MILPLLLALLLAATLGGQARSWAAVQTGLARTPGRVLAQVTGARTAEPSLWQYLRAHTEFKLYGRVIAYEHKPEARQGLDDSTVAGDGRFTMQTRLTRGQHQFGLAAWLAYGSQKDTYSQTDYGFGISHAEPDIERQRRYVELNELYWIASWDRLDMTLGKKVYALGVAPLYAPSDRLSPFDLNDPLAPKRYGLWQLGLDYYRGNSTVSVALLPFFTPPKIPSARSRWRLTGIAPTGAAVPNDFQFFTTTARLDTDIPSGVDALQALLHVKTTWAGWDVFVAGFSGISPYPVLRQERAGTSEASLVRTYIRATTASAGFSTTLAKFEVHGEGVLQWSWHNKDDDYFAALVGVTYTMDDWLQVLGLDRLELTLDYGREVVLERQHHDDFVASSALVRIGQDDLFLLAALFCSADLTLKVFVNIDFDDGGVFIAPELSYRAWPGLWLKVRSERFQGPAESFYGRWQRHDRLILAFEYSF